MTIDIRPIRPGEGAALLKMVHALAESHGMLHKQRATPEGLEQALFAKEPIVGCLKALAREAVRRGYPSIFWVMMGWNDGARTLYQEVGAEIDNDLAFCRIADHALKNLAESA